MIDTNKALEVITSIIQRCENAQLKFKSGTSQHSLLRNRLNALAISKTMLLNQDLNHVSDDELTQSLPPITSIINKCKKAQSKYHIGSAQYKRYINIIETMSLSKSLILQEINRRNKITL